MKAVEIVFSADINIVTYTMMLKGMTNKHGVPYFVSNSKLPTVLYLADNLEQDPPIQTIKNLLKKYAVIVVTPEITTPISHPQLVYVQTPFRLYNDETIKKVQNIIGVGAYGAIAHDIADLLSTKLDIRKYSNLDKQLFKNEDAVLIQDYDGLGDILMLHPTLKAYSKKGFQVEVITRYTDAMKDLPFIDAVYDSCEEHPKSNMYGRYYDITFKLSQYEQNFCRQHRIFATAHLCGLKPEDLVSDRPEILLAQKEIDYAESLIPKGQRICISLSSADRRRGYPKDKIQTLINEIARQFPKTQLVLVGEKERDMKSYEKCIDLRGKTSIRELFAVVNACSSVLTIDSSVLHIAAAFKKPTVLMPSTVPAEWRKYKETRIVPPPVKCYPCGDRNETCKNNTVGGWCLGEIKLGSILRELKKTL